MKIFSTMLIIISMALISCSEDTGNNPDNGWTQSEAIVIGPDLTLCSCCGGWLVQIGNDTLRIFNMINEVTSLMKDRQMPVPVSIKWKKLISGCGASFPNLIEIKDIKLIEFILSEGEILGRDFRKCLCCGGWFTKIVSDTFRILNMPDDFEKALDTLKMPAPVILSWRKMIFGCGKSMTDLIEVNKIFLKNANFTISDGKITYEDLRECVCCGGYFIMIDGAKLRIFHMPEYFSAILRSLQLPVEVTLSWKKMTEDCGAVMDDIIDVGKIYLK